MTAEPKNANPGSGGQVVGREEAVLLHRQAAKVRL
jgi:hypothetical protein